MRFEPIFLVIGIVLITLAGSGPQKKTSNRALLAPPKDLKYFTLGYHESTSDSIWLRVIQDIDLCDRTASGEVVDAKTQRETPEAHDQSGEIPAGGWSAHDPGRCRDESWVYTMLDAVTSLTPRFRIPYSAGGTLLSVVVRDYGGATELFERGMRQFPNDWPLEYKAAFHYLYNLGNQSRAAELLLRAAKDGGPQWLYSLAAKLYTAEGQALLAKTVLQEVLKNDPNARFAKRLQQRIDEADAVLAKQKSMSSDRSGDGTSSQPASGH